LPIPLKIDTIEKLYIAIKYNFVPKEVVEIHLAKGISLNASEVYNKKRLVYI